MFQSLQLLPHHFFSPLSPPCYPSFTILSSSSFCFRVASVSPLRAKHQIGTELLLEQLAEVATENPPEDGPIELPPMSSFSSSIFATTDNPSPLQVATSVLLTGAISVFLFRSLRRRAKRAKELRLRSSGVTKKSLKDEALESLKALKPNSVETEGPPSPVQALLGGLSAGVIALVLYKFTTTIEASLNRQAISDNFSVKYHF